MSLFDSPDNLKLIQDLLNPKDGNHSDLESEEEDEVAVARRQKFTPADVGAEKDSKKQDKGKSSASKIEEKVPQSIEEWQEMHEAEDAAILDSRKKPSYNIAYRQAIGTEDVFFQLSNRTNASASCEDMIVEISLPDETVAADKMDLSICEKEVDLSTPLYHLKLPLPHAIDCDRSRAKYDVPLKQLTLTLRLKREFDFVNF